MAEVWPPVPPATHEAPGAKPGAKAAGVRKATPRRENFGSINGRSSSSRSDDSRTSSDSSNSNNSGNAREETCAGPGGFR